MRNLDAAGCAPVSEAVLDAFTTNCRTADNVNPHSSSEICQKISACRTQILQFANANPLEYDCIFTHSNTHSLEKIANAFPWRKGHSAFAYTLENHTSVVGIREIAAANGAGVAVVDVDSLSQSRNDAVKTGGNGNETFSLFAMPCECNLSGDVFDVRAVLNAVSNGALDGRSSERSSNNSTRWITLVDAAKSASDFGVDVQGMGNPDFIIFSPYKLTGIPQGLGILIAKSATLSIMCKSYMGGGTVAMVSASSMVHHWRQSDIERFEDGTINFQAVFAMRSVIEVCKQRLSAINMSKSSLLRSELVDKLLALRHGNGKQVSIIFSCTQMRALGQRNIQEDEDMPLTPSGSGNIVAFLLMNSEGSVIPPSEVQRVFKSSSRIIIRSGAVCNPGAAQRYLGLSSARLLKNYSQGHKCGDDMDVVDGWPTGVCRISFDHSFDSKDISEVISCIRSNFVDLSTPKVFHADCPSLGSEYLIDKLIIYPIKSCRGYEIPERQSWRIGKTGLFGDRMFIMIDKHTHELLTLKKLPLLGAIQPTMLNGGLVMRLEADGSRSVTVPLDFQDSKWKMQTSSDDDGEDLFILDDNRVMNFLRTVLKRSVTLASKVDGTGSQNSCPIMAIGSKTLEMVDSLIPEASSCALHRLRPNIVLRTTAAFEEDHLACVQTDGHVGCIDQESPRSANGADNRNHPISFQRRKLCVRCTTINVNSDKHASDMDLLLQLSKIRRFGFKTLVGVLFGVSVMGARQQTLIAGNVMKATSVSLDSALEKYIKIGPAYNSWLHHSTAYSQVTADDCSAQACDNMYHCLRHPLSKLVDGEDIADDTETPGVVWIHRNKTCSPNLVHDIPDSPISGNEQQQSGVGRERRETHSLVHTISSTPSLGMTAQELIPLPSSPAHESESPESNADPQNTADHASKLNVYAMTITAAGFALALIWTKLSMAGSSNR